ncbi:hypothetical protein [Bacillus sp. Marseille-Q3570]|uniref:hypothetical protein n=1 Tax=Bacillus sp. Marseille-Q3570 TaxID=2963522 RepID=UPI0021B78286|nr:hypothetical protein [Bacillus sp. Marseille-Q3570]
MGRINDLVFWVTSIGSILTLGVIICYYASLGKRVSEEEKNAGKDLTTILIHLQALQKFKNVFYRLVWNLHSLKEGRELDDSFREAWTNRYPQWGTQIWKVKHSTGDPKYI